MVLLRIDETYLLTRMPTGCLRDKYSMMTVQKYSGSQWSGNFSSPPSCGKRLNLKTRNNEQRCEVSKDTASVHQKIHISTG